MTNKNRRARCYEITTVGRGHLAAAKRDLDRMVSTIDVLFQEPAWTPGGRN